MVEGDRGSASLEFLVVAVGFLVPLVALSVTVTEVSTATLAATTASRQAARAFTRAESASAGLRRITAATELVLDDHGLGDHEWSFDVDCSSPQCLRRGSLDTVTVRVAVPLRFVPALPGLSIPAVVTVERSTTVRVSIDSVSR
jgi:hypothetical protein